jgi:pyruvoyl-dependent arginine decarboxylase (PvlArgDC)
MQQPWRKRNVEPCPVSINVGDTLECILGEDRHRSPERGMQAAAVMTFCQREVRETADEKRRDRLLMTASAGTPAARAVRRQAAGCFRWSARTDGSRIR